MELCDAYSYSTKQHPRQQCACLHAGQDADTLTGSPTTWQRCHRPWKRSIDWFPNPRTRDKGCEIRTFVSDVSGVSDVSDVSDVSEKVKTCQTTMSAMKMKFCCSVGTTRQQVRNAGCAVTSEQRRPRHCVPTAVLIYTHSSTHIYPFAQRRPRHCVPTAVLIYTRSRNGVLPRQSHIMRDFTLTAVRT